jgi:hypothetical protein
MDGIGAVLVTELNDEFTARIAEIEAMITHRNWEVANQVRMEVEGVYKVKIMEALELIGRESLMGESFKEGIKILKELVK